MNEDDRARPVSGEIMTGGAGKPVAGDSGLRSPDFSEAVFEAVPNRAAVPPQRSADTVAPAGLSLLAGGSAAIRRESSHGGPVFWGVGILLVALAFWVSGGHALVRDLGFDQVRQVQQPLRIAEVKSRVERHGGRDVLFVDGRAENHGPHPVFLPPIQIAVIGNDGGTVRYNLGTNGAELGPGGRYSFSSRLEAPRNGVKSVSVTFQEAGR